MDKIRIDFFDYASYKEYIKAIDILEILGWDKYYHHEKMTGNEVLEDYTMFLNHESDIWTKTNKILDILRR